VRTARTFTCGCDIVQERMFPWEADMIFPPPLNGRADEVTE
jgi:hypothetical protein